MERRQFAADDYRDDSVQTESACSAAAVVHVRPVRFAGEQHRTPCHGAAERFHRRTAALAAAGSAWNGTGASTSASSLVQTARPAVGAQLGRTFHLFQNFSSGRSIRQSQSGRCHGTRSVAGNFRQLLQRKHKLLPEVHRWMLPATPQTSSVESTMIGRKSRPQIHEHSGSRFSGICGQTLDRIQLDSQNLSNNSTAFDCRAMPNVQKRESHNFCRN